MASSDNPVGLHNPRRHEHAADRLSLPSRFIPREAGLARFRNPGVSHPDSVPVGVLSKCWPLRTFLRIKISGGEMSGSRNRCSYHRVWAACRSPSEGPIAETGSPFAGWSPGPIRVPSSKSQWGQLNRPDCPTRGATAWYLSPLSFVNREPPSVFS